MISKNRIFIGDLYGITNRNNKKYIRKMIVVKIGNNFRSVQLIDNQKHYEKLRGDWAMGEYPEKDVILEDKDLSQHIYITNIVSYNGKYKNEKLITLEKLKEEDKEFLKEYVNKKNSENEKNLRVR